MSNAGAELPFTGSMLTLPLLLIGLVLTAVGALMARVSRQPKASQTPPDLG